MFKVGDAIVHPLHGAGIVTGFKSLGQQSELRYYNIELMGDRKTSLMVPVQRANEVGLRTAIASSNLGEVWQVLFADPVSLPQDHKQRYKILTDQLHDRITLNVAGVVRDMVWRQHQTGGNLAQKGREILQKSVHMLAEEVAVSSKISLEAAEDLIHTKIGSILPPPCDAQTDQVLNQSLTRLR